MQRRNNKAGARTKAVPIDRFLWLKILISGIVMFVLLERAVVVTGSVTYIPSLLAVGTFTLPLAFVAFLYTRNKTPRVSVSNLLICVLWGGVVGTVLAGLVEYQTLVHLGVLPTLLIGLIEEVAKMAVPALLILGRQNRSEIDSIVIGAASGAGFAAFESMGYGLTALLATGGDVTAATQVLLLRALMAPAVHIAWTALTTDALWHLSQDVSPSTIRRFIFTFLGVIALHAAWDSVVQLSWLPYIILGVLGLGWLLLRIRRAANETGLLHSRAAKQLALV
jgi:RsiW-degrading membrane proteinase PrsW (M82 family)